MTNTLSDEAIEAAVLLLLDEKKYRKNGIPRQALHNEFNRQTAPVGQLNGALPDKILDNLIDGEFITAKKPESKDPKQKVPEDEEITRHSRDSIYTITTLGRERLTSSEFAPAIAQYRANVKISPSTATADDLAEDDFTEQLLTRASAASSLGERETRLLRILSESADNVTGSSTFNEVNISYVDTYDRMNIIAALSANYPLNKQAISNLMDAGLAGFLNEGGRLVITDLGRDYLVKLDANVSPAVTVTLSDVAAGDADKNHVAALQDGDTTTTGRSGKKDQIVR